MDPGIEGWEADLVDSTDDPLAALTRRESIEAVQAALDRLPLPLREVVALCEIEGLKYEEAASIVGIPVGTVRSRLHRAKKVLLTELASLRCL